MSQSRHGAKRGLILHVVPIFDDTGIVDFTAPPMPEPSAREE
jgi:hypothetical protein